MAQRITPQRHGSAPAAPTSTNPDRSRGRLPADSRGSASTTASTPTSRPGCRAGRTRFLINPYGLRFEEVTASNLVTVDLDGNVIDDPMGLGINPAGFTIHSADPCSARHDAICVLHTHTVARHRRRLPKRWPVAAQSMVAAVYRQPSPITTTKASRSISMSVQRLVADLGDKFVMVLRNHGMLTCGRSVAGGLQADAQSGALLPRPARRAVVRRRHHARCPPPVARKTAGQYAQLLRRDGNQWRARTANGPPSSGCWSGPIPDFAN